MSQKSVLIQGKSIEGYESIAEFLSSCKSKYTAKGYRTALTRFFSYVQTTDKLFNPDSSVKLEAHILNPIVLKYAMHLKQVAKDSVDDFKRGEVSVNSVAFYINAVKQFYDHHSVEGLTWKKIKKYIPEKVHRTYHVYSKEEIAKLLAVSNPRERTMILLLVSSGIRAEALLQIRIRDFEVVEDNIGHLVIYPTSARFRYHTYCTPEATAAIQFYLKWREEMGEEIKPESPLIRTNIRDKFSKKAKHPEPLKYFTLWEIMQKLIKKANITNDNNYSLQPNHAFRKSMNTILANAEVSPMFKEVMLGHSLKLDNVYYDKDDPQSLKTLLKEYRKAIDALTINDEHRLKIQLEHAENERDDAIREKDTLIGLYEKKLAELFTWKAEQEKRQADAPSPSSAVSVNSD